MQRVESHPLYFVAADPSPQEIQSVQRLHLNLRYSPPLGPPFSILFLEDESVILSDELNHRLLRFDPQGELIWQLGGKGNSLGKFWYPRGMALAGSELYVCDSWNHRIQVINLGAHPLRSIGSSESNGLIFDECSDVRVDSKGQLWAVDTGNHCLKVLSPTGDLLHTIGRRLSKAEEKALQLSPESGLDLHTRPGFCYPRRFLTQYPFGFCLEDRGNDRILLFADDGLLYAELDTEGGQVVFSHAAFSQSWDYPAHLPIAYLLQKRHCLEVFNWQGAAFFETPVARFSEVQSELVQEDGGRNGCLLIHTFDWMNQDIVKYKILIPSPAGTESGIQEAVQ